MPRLPTKLLLQARAENPLLAHLLPTCRDLPSARNELRWLTEHLRTQVFGKHHTQNGGKGFSYTNITVARKRHRNDECNFSAKLKKICVNRGRGKPLQYLIGTEWFGELELQCRSGILIPRPETAAITTELVHRLASGSGNENGKKLPESLRVLDLCTGTGCMSFLLHHEVHSRFKRMVTLQSLGIDISPKAISLAKANQQWLNVPNTGQLNRFHGSKGTGGSTIDFALADVLNDDDAAPNAQSNETTTYRTIPPSIQTLLTSRGLTTWDILLANPPYISPSSFMRSTTSRSVRNYEPRLALVPPLLPAEIAKITETALSRKETSTEIDTARGDLFYPRILSRAADLDVKLVLFEVGDMAQAMRVARMAAAQHTRPLDSISGDEVRQVENKRHAHDLRPEKLWSNIEIWCDGIGELGAQVLSEDMGLDTESTSIGAASDDDGSRATNEKGRMPCSVTIKRLKHETTPGRAVVCWRGDAVNWMAGHI